MSYLSEFRLLIVSVIFLFIHGSIAYSIESEKDALTRRACERNSRLVLCDSMKRRRLREQLGRIMATSTTILPPRTSTLSPTGNNAARNSPSSNSQTHHHHTTHQRVKLQAKDSVQDINREFNDKLIASKATPTGEDLATLREKCLKVSPLVRKHCQQGHITPGNAGRCASYFRDCSQFLPKDDPLAAIGNSFSSGVGLNLGTVDVKGIPYYPVNEEGAIGVGVNANIPFGSWGGGFSSGVGVRDYWSQNMEVGANWIDGKYGYKNGWSVPLVQSLGVEGGQHNVVSFPLTGPRAHKLMIDNGYHVGPYFGINDHVGVDYRGGDVIHTSGVGVPFAGTGVMTGQAVTFPGLDVWQRALGR